MSPALIDALLGGVLIGLGAATLLVMNGRIAGVAGLLRWFARFEVSADWLEAAAFLGGLVLGAAAMAALIGAPAIAAPADWPIMLVGAVIVGVGVTMGNGCTSGHGVCGLARLSRRSLVSTAVFMAACALTVFVMRHVL